MFHCHRMRIFHFYSFNLSFVRNVFKFVDPIREHKIYSHENGSQSQFQFASYYLVIHLCCVWMFVIFIHLLFRPLSRFLYIHMKIIFLFYISFQCAVPVLCAASKTQRKRRRISAVRDTFNTNDIYTIHISPLSCIPWHSPAHSTITMCML